MLKTLEGRFTAFLLGFALLFAFLIYARESWDDYRVSLPLIILWQLLIWLPWALSLKPLHLVANRLNRGVSLKNIAALTTVSVVLLSLHIFYFFSLSKTTSPLLHLPHTAFGVYPYFFIFFALIDVVIIWGLSARLGVFQILEEPPLRKTEDSITVKKGPNSILIQTADLHWVAAEDYYSKLHTRSGSYMLRQPLKVLIDRLPPDKFVQIHRSTIVNIDYIKESNSQAVTLADDTVRNMSRPGYKRLKQLY